MHRLRPARAEDIPELVRLIEQSVRTLNISYYTPSQVESALRHVFGPDTRLIADGTYYVIEGDTGRPIAAGGWSWRQALCGGDLMKQGPGPLLVPVSDAARIRVVFVQPEGPAASWPPASSTALPRVRPRPGSAGWNWGDAARGLS